MTNYGSLIAMAKFLVLVAPFVLIGAHREGERRKEKQRRQSEIPLGISEAYDLLLPDGEVLDVRCQDCDRVFVDRMRKHGVTARVLAIFCPECRSQRRMQLAQPLPRAIDHR